MEDCPALDSVSTGRRSGYRPVGEWQSRGRGDVSGQRVSITHEGRREKHANIPDVHPESHPRLLVSL